MQTPVAAVGQGVLAAGKIPGGAVDWQAVVGPGRRRDSGLVAG